MMTYPAFFPIFFIILLQNILCYFFLIEKYFKSRGLQLGLQETLEALNKLKWYYNK